MNAPRRLHHQTAVVTGESIREIARRGFVPLSTIPVEQEPEDLILDWDASERSRNVALVDQPRLRRQEGAAPACC